MAVTINIDGKRVQFDAMPSPEDIDHVAEQLKLPAGAPQEGAAMGAVVGDAMGKAPEQAGGHSLARTLATGAGGVAGAGTGLMTGGFRGALRGGLMGAGLGGSAYDLATGDPRETGGRFAAQVAAPILLQATPAGQAMSTGKAVVASGLATALAGQAFDFMDDLMSGKPRTLKDAILRTVEDFVGGVAGEGIARSGEGPAMTRATRRQEFQSKVARRQAAFAREGITPKVSELTDSMTASTLEDIPRGTLGGAEPVQEFDRLRNAQARARAEEHVAGISPAGIENAEHGGYVLRHHIARQHAEEQATWGRMFDETEAVTGDDPVVPVTNLLPALRTEADVGARTPAGAKGYQSRLQRLDARSGALKQFARDLVRVFGLSPEDADVFLASLGRRGPTVEGIGARSPDVPRGDLPLKGDLGGAIPRIPFWLARRLESQLGQMGYRGRPPVGATPDQMAAARAYRALLSDLGEFYDSPLTPEGAGVAEKLGRAKELYRHGLSLYNEGKARNFLGTQAPEQAFANAFIPGNVTATRDLQAVVPDEVFDQAAQGWLNGIYRKFVHEVGDREEFNAGGFARELEKYERNGHLDVILGPERANELRETLATYREMTSVPITGRSSGTAERFARYGQMAGLAALPLDFLGHLFRGEPGQGLYGAGLATGGAIGVPVALGQATTTAGGRAGLTRALTPAAPFGATTRRGLSQGAGLGLEDVIRSLAQQLGR